MYLLEERKLVDAKGMLKMQQRQGSCSLSVPEGGNLPGYGHTWAIPCGVLQGCVGRKATEAYSH